ncbi:MAG TPA: hypothetical protein VGG33_17510, partial [Polyangia bacterium]
MLTMLAWMSAILACLLLVVALLPLTFEWQIIGTRVRSRLLWGFGVVSLELRRPRGARRARSDVRSRRGGKAQPPRPGLVMQILAEPSFRGALV